jgi:magnesium-transporting ATPase (P-type)
MYDQERDMRGGGGGRRTTAHGLKYDSFDLESITSSTTGNKPSDKVPPPKKYPTDSGSVYSTSGRTTATTATTATSQSKGLSNKLRYSEHGMTLDELAEVFETHINISDPIRSRGLSADTAHERQRNLGKNTMTQHKSAHPLRVFLLQFTDTFMALLQFAAFLSLLAWTLEEDPVDLYVGIFLLLAVFLQCIATFRQEARSDQLMDKFRLLAPQFCICIREGVQLRIDSEQLVVGDLVKLYTGCKVPSDCRLIYLSPGYIFRVDQSSITGENEPVECNAGPSKETSVLDAYNVIFSGSLVVEGEALAVVVRSGDGTLLGDMVKVTGGVEKELSTLKKDLKDFVWVVARLSVGIGIVVCLLGVFRGLPLMETLMDGLVVTIIANLPCGLPATVTACLLIVAERLRANNVFIKRLDGIETLGACSLICTDKTGTLTQNSMSVTHAWVLEDANSGVFIPQVSSLLNTEKFVEACVCGSSSAAPSGVGVATGRFEGTTEESASYRTRTNGFSDLSAAALLLKLGTLNSRVTLLQSAPENVLPPMNNTLSGAGLDEYDLESSRRGLLDASVKSAVSSASAPRRYPGAGPLLPTGDATEVGIYKFCQHVTAVCHRYVQEIQDTGVTMNPLAGTNANASASAQVRGQSGLSVAEAVSAREAVAAPPSAENAILFPTGRVEEVRSRYEKVVGRNLCQCYQCQCYINVMLYHVLKFECCVKQVDGVSVNV